MAAPFDPYHYWLGIPPQEQPPNHYRLLGLSVFESRPEAIEAAADQQVARLQKAQVGPYAAVRERLLGEVAAARLCLLHPARKLEYDESLRQQLKSGSTAAPPAGSADGALPGLFAEPTGDGQGTKRGRKKLLVAVLVAASALATLLLLWPAGEEPVVADGTLLVDWPEEQRVGATLELDGVAQQVSAMGPLEYPCRPGEVRVAIAAPGRKPLERTATIESGRKRLVSMRWEGPPERVALAAEKTAAAEKRVETQTPPSAKTTASKVAAAGGVKENPDSAVADPSPSPETEPSPSEPPKTASSTPEKPDESSISSKPESAERVEPSGPGPRPAASGQKPPVKEGPRPIPAEVPAVAEYDAPVAEAWQLVQQKEAKQAHEKLLTIYKKDRKDFRVAFSLGLIESLVRHDWPEAEKHFETCLRLLPDHLPTLNNLALVRARTGDEQQAIRHWEAVLAAGPAPAEVIQNLRRLQSFVHVGHVKLKPSQVKAIDDLATRASPTGSGYKANQGYLFMPLATADGEIVGWKDLRLYQDRWCLYCDGRGTIRCTNRECSHGTVRQTQNRVVGVNPVNKTRIVETVPIRVPCPTCKGEGWIDCKKCDQGIDPNLKYPTRQ